MEHTDEGRYKNWNMCLDGTRLFVRSSRYTIATTPLTFDSTGICALIRTILFTDGTSATDNGDPSGFQLAVTDQHMLTCIVGGSIDFAIWAM